MNNPLEAGVQTEAGVQKGPEADIFATADLLQRLAAAKRDAEGIIALDLLTAAAEDHGFPEILSLIPEGLDLAGQDAVAKAVCVKVVAMLAVVLMQKQATN